MMRNNQSLADAQFDEGIFQKQRLGNNSGYLQEQYEITKQFPMIHDFHFRIEDQQEIMQLQKLQRQSQPISMQQTFCPSSQEFKQRLNLLINVMDSNQVKFQNTIKLQKHGFYQLADSYDDELAIQAVLQKARIEDLRKQVEQMNIKAIKPVFIKRSGKTHSEAIKSKQQVQQLSKKMRRITIREEDF